ncbi:MAG: hypothetical protein RSD10_04810 [Anaerovoracaceae bacterium]
MELKPYEKLGNAIIVQAAKDYRSALKTLIRNNKNQIALSEKRKIEKFFRSDWYELLTDISADYLIKHIEKEVGFNE